MMNETKSQEGNEKLTTRSSHSYLIFSSRLSPRTADRFSRITGVSSTHPRSCDPNGLEKHRTGSSTRIGHSVSHTPSTNSLKHPTDLEAQTYPLEDLSAPPMPAHPNTIGTAATTGQGDERGRDVGRTRSGGDVQQEVALANLDPRAQATVKEGEVDRLGTSAHAVANTEGDSPPGSGINVRRDWSQEVDEGRI